MSVIQDVILTKDTTSVTLPPPQQGAMVGTEQIQSKGETADGTVYVYAKDVTHYDGKFSFLLDRSEAEALESFFTSTVKGMLYTFAMRDHLGQTYSGCRFQEPKLQLVKQNSGLYHVELAVISAALME